MKAIEISKAYLERVVAPVLQERFPEQYERCATGLLGKGSDSSLLNVLEDCADHRFVAPGYVGIAENGSGL